MKLNPKQAPIYGECVLTVHLNKRNKRKAGVFYLLFSGSTQKHVASTQRVNSATLQTIAPAHDCCESVTVLLCASKKGSVVVVGEESFEFIHDEAYDSAQLLAANAANQQVLNFARFLVRAQPCLGEVTILDKKITLAFKHLQLPSEWNVLGKCPLTDGHKQETLLHFAARLGLCHLSKFLLERPGGRTALTISNSEGATPARLALERGFQDLAHLFSEDHAEGTPLPSNPSHVEHIDGCWLKHHFELNVYILTRKADQGSPSSMEALIEDLCRHMEGHSDCQGSGVKSEPKPNSEETELQQQDPEETPTDKTQELNSDLDNTNKKLQSVSSEESSVSYGEERCTVDKVKKVCTKSGTEEETVGGDSEMFFFAGTNVEPKEEEEGTLLVESEDESLTQQHIQSFPTKAEDAGTLLSSGNSNEETGMTSTGIVLDHKGLCGRDNLDEEMITTTESANPDVALTEAPNKAAELTLDTSVDMGQVLPGYCTSTADTKDTACNTESSEQEVGLVTPLLLNDSQAIESLNNGFSQGELNGMEQCDMAESVQSQEFTALQALDCSEACDIGEPKRNASTLHSESLDQAVDCVCETTKDKAVLSNMHITECQLVGRGTEAGVMLENEASAPSAQEPEDQCVITNQDMPGCCTSSERAMDSLSNAESSEQGVAALLSGDDNRSTNSILNSEEQEPSPCLSETFGPCDMIVSGLSKDCTSVSISVCSEAGDSYLALASVSAFQTESIGPNINSLRLSSEDQNAVTMAGVPECLPSDVNDTGLALEKDTAAASTLCTHETLERETPSLVECVEEEEPGEVAKQEALVECDKVDGGSELLKVSRTSLQPIAEESLFRGDSGTDNAPPSTDSETTSANSDSEKPTLPEEKNSGQKMNQASDTEDCSIERIAAALVNAVVDSTTELCMKEMVNAASGMLLSECTSCSSPSDLLQTEKDCVQDTGESFHVFKEDDSGLDLSGNMEETLCPSISDTEVTLESLDGKGEDEVDFVKAGIHMINRESCCSLTPCPHPGLLDSKQTNDSKVCEQFLEDGLDIDRSSPQTPNRESASDTDLCYMAPEVIDEMVFAKLEEEQSLCDVSSSGSEDNTSLERTSSHGSDISIPRTLNMKKQLDRHSMDSSCSSTVTASVEERECDNTGVSEVEGEEMDNVSDVSSNITRPKSTIRSISPPRRHSWEPWKHTPSDSEVSRRSSLRIIGDDVRKQATHKRSMSWCPSSTHSTSVCDEVNYRSYSLEGLAAKTTATSDSLSAGSGNLSALSAYEEETSRGSSVSLTEDKPESEQRKSAALHPEQGREKTHSRGFVYSNSGFTPHLTKSMSLTTISSALVETQNRIRPKRRISFSFSISPLIPKSKHIFTVGSSSSDDESDSSQFVNISRNSLAQSIPEEGSDILPLVPSSKDLELKGGTKVSRTFSYLRNKMAGGKKTKEKEKDKTKEKDREPKEKDKDKKSVNGHAFCSTPVVGPFTCYHCSKSFNKDCYICANCNSMVHKSCRENFTPCAKVKMKQQKVLQPNDTSSLPVVVMRNKGSQPKERPRSAIMAADETAFTPLSFTNRRPQTTISISKSVSTQNIAGVGCDENIWGTWKSLSKSTDSLHKIDRVNESMESLVDEGTDMNEGQLMGEFEADSKQLEAESWSQTVDSKFLKQMKKEVVKRQDVIYELMQTEMHHVRTLKIMSEVYCRGMLTELQFEQKILEKIFPCIDDLLNIHTQFFQRILERKKESMAERSENNFVIRRIGDILMHQFSGENAEHMKRTYGKFCGHHNDAVNYFKDLLSKEKRFQAFIKKKGSSSVVRRLGIPECILLVTQRITKYPVLLQRILQYTKENEVEHEEVEKAFNLVKDIITEVNNKVNNYEKKKRLYEIYNKTDSKSLQRMKCGQMFAKEDLKRRKLVRDGQVFLRSSPASRMKEVLAVLLTDVLVFLQEKDQKYVFASLEQKSTVISLKKLIVRKVAHDEKGLFLISMIEKDPEMVEVLTITKEERDSWINTIQETMTSMDKDDDEGVPSESEEERKNWDTKAQELRVCKHTVQLHQKDEQILTLLDEKEKLFQSLTLCNVQEENMPGASGRTLFRSNTDEAPRGEPLIKSAIKEVETLEVLVNQYLWSSIVAQESAELENGVGPVSLPRRAETFGGFDSHQLNTSKSGEKDEGEDSQDLRRTESESVLKKGVNPNAAVKRNGLQVLMSVSNLHKHLKSLQAVVIQQDTYIEDQRMLLTKGVLSRKSRPSSLNDQLKQRSLEKLRQEMSSLEKQQAQHREDKLRNECQWESREKKFAEWKEWSSMMDDNMKKSMQEMEQKKHRLEIMKALGHCDLDGLNEEVRSEKRQEQRNKDLKAPPLHHDKLSRVPSLPAGMDSTKWCDSNKQEQLHSEPSTSPKKDLLIRTDSKQKGKGHFSLLGGQSNKSTEGHSSNRLFNLSKPKEKKDKKKGKGTSPLSSDTHHHVEGTTEDEEIFC
ncbi:A-kinase anchor protein 13 [Gastrophryne carolinensis]